MLGSFALYLVPLVGPHAAWPLGAVLYRELTHGGDRDLWWRVTDVALALATQVGVWLLLRWSLRGSLARLSVWLGAIPAIAAGLNVAYLVAIPSYFLIEPDTAPERRDWVEHCVVPGVALMPVRTPARQPVGGVRQWWVQRPNAGYALLRLPDCSLADARLPRPTVQSGGRVDFLLGLQFAAHGGAATLERFDTGTQRQSWWVLADPEAPLMPLPSPADAEGAPILSNAADAVAWMQRVAGSAPPVERRVAVRPIGSSPTMAAVDIEMAPFGPASYSLLELDTLAREITLWRDDGPLVVGFDGTRHDRPFSPREIRPAAGTYLRHADVGWVAWDAYQDTAPYRLEWSLAAGAGTHRTNKGRSIIAAAVDPTGAFIAISESTTLSIGTARDVVYVLRASDGTDAFRAYLPRYSRSPVVFFEGGLFAYSDLDGIHVLRMP